ncbi:MAG TPA: ORF6N domain-containing protein [Opitutaceae bacterium]|nr:ORF6N domain-containing protein [Opitutaceae bacterium]
MAKQRAEPALPAIHAIRKQKVVLDSDLAALYGVPTFRLNEAVKRNADRFPSDFRFQLVREEVANLKSQNAISSSSAHGGRRQLPWAFTEHGALMAANILRSPRAVQMSIYLVRAFVRMRDELMANAAILKRLAEVDRRLLEHDSVLREVVERLQPLLDAPDEEEEPKSKIGFHQGNR